MSIIGQTLLNQYRIDKNIAETHLGEVFRAWDLRRNKPVSITILQKKISEDNEKLKEFEAQSNGFKKVMHPNIIPFLGVLQTPTLAFILEEWVDGASLRDVMNTGLLSINEALVYIKAICSALEYLHRNNYIYSYLSPENIHINRDGEIFLGSLAVLQLNNTQGVLHGNKKQARYEAPEQFNKKNITPATDIYSLAAIIYEAVTGSLPKNKNPNTLNPTISDHFSRMLMWALRKDETRLSNTTELLSALALAAQINIDEIPLRATLETAPVTAAVAKGWHYLPTPQPNILTSDALPLDERLASVTSSPPKPKRSYWRVSTLATLLIVGAYLASQIEPAQTTPIIPSAQPTREIRIPLLNTKPLPTLTPFPKPTDSHGGRIIFTCTRGEYNQLCTINADGTGYKRISDQLANDYYPAFSPQGGAFVFSSNRNGAFDIYLFLIANNDLFQLTDRIGNVVSPDFSPDGEKIVFANRASTGPTSIWIVDRLGLNPRLIHTGPNAIVATAWSPNGDKIAYALQQDSPNEYQVFLMDVDGRNHQRVTNGLQGVGGSIDWAPDGKSILIYAGAFGAKEIFNVNVETGDFTQLTFGGNNAAASYSPDGKYIVFNSLRNNEQADLFIMNADGHSTRQLTDDPEPDWQPVWEP